MLCYVQRRRAEKALAAKSCLLNGVGHTIRSHSSHHAQLLQRILVLPLLWKLFLFWRLTLNELLPALRRALDVAVQILKLVRVRQRLRNNGVAERQLTLKSSSSVLMRDVIAQRAVYYSSSVCLSACLSQSCIVSEKLNISS